MARVPTLDNNDNLHEKFLPDRLSESGLTATFVAAVVLSGAGIDPTGAADSTTAIQAKINGATAGATVLVPPGVYKLTDDITITKSLTVRALGGGAQFVQSVGGKSAFHITASDVTIEGLRLTGPQFANLVSNEYGIKAVGALASYLSNIAVRHCRIDRWGHTGVWFEFAENAKVLESAFADIAYAGILYLSVTDGQISGNQVKDIVQGSGATNSYGIAVTRSQGSLEIYPRSTDVLVSGNVVDGVTSWEGLDTHAGQRITFVGNSVKNCKTGIAVVGSTDATAAVAFAPLDILVTGNAIDSGVSNGSRGIGVTFVGATSGALGSPTELATGSVIGNAIRGHGAESGSTSGAIVAYVTSGLVVAGNRIIDPSPNGVCLQYDNYGFVCQGNTVTDAWSQTSGIATAVCVSSNYNSGRIDGNQAIRSTKTATLVFSQGIRLASNDATVQVSLGRNNMSAATAPLSDAGQRTTGGIDASNIGFFGATPVAKPTSTTDLKTALVNLGLYTSGGATPLNLNGGALIARNITSTGHILVTSGTAPTATAGTGAGTSPPSPTLDSGAQDSRGTVNLGTGTTPSTADQVTVTYGTTWGAVPDVVITPLNAASAALQPYVSLKDTSKFRIAFGVAPAESQSVGTYKFAYIVLGW